MITAILSLLFWGSIGLLAHTYAFYPLLMRFLARGRALPPVDAPAESDLPEVAVLMAVYNEETVLEETLCSILDSDYPLEKLAIHIGSDGSTDRSEAIVRRFAADHPGLRLVTFGGRNGKIRIINQLAATAEAAFADPDKAIFILCDANVSWRPQTLRLLVSHFVREQVGLVGTVVLDRVREHAGIGDQEEAYIGIENQVKFAEGVLWGRLMGAFGACYAMRARLFTPVPPEHIVDDFYLTMSCLEQGADAIVDPGAVVHEAVSTDIREEFRRKRRIAAGNFQNLARFWHFLQPWHSDPATTFAFWSHKGLRWTGPLLLIAAFASCVALAFREVFYLLPLAGFAALGLAAALDARTAGRGRRSFKPFRFARYFLSMNLALFRGWLDYLRGPKGSVWEPTRRVAVSNPSPAAAAETDSAEPAPHR